MADQVYLFGLSSRRADWLSARQAVVAENVANVSTPAYKAKDVKGFSEALRSTQLAMTGDSPLHLVSDDQRKVDIEQQRESTWGVVHSGNSVSLEQEMLKGGEVQSAYSLNSSIAKAFQRFYLTSVKG